MPVNPEHVAAQIREAIAPGFRRELLAKGHARSMIWRDGALPPDSPDFSELLSHDLLSYAFGLITQGLRLLDARTERDIARSAFENAASAIEAVIVRSAADENSAFHRLVAGACYHLAGYSARAFSLLHGALEVTNLSRPERAVALLILRNLNDLEDLVAQNGLDERATDTALLERLAQIDASASDSPDEAPESEGQLEHIVSTALANNFLAAIGGALLAFERGESSLLAASLDRLRIGLSATGELNFASQWWCHRLAAHLLDDLWSSSFHERLPPRPPTDQTSDWAVLRELFIATLLRRSRAEIELWPSQLEAASRALNIAENLVVSLPTSAGKTRIAELCILACLATGRRAVFVTPLRALSAQTEVTLQRTFLPLGKTVSTLYGAIGVSSADTDFMRNSDIIVATPEKLDFALRSNPDLLDDVGLVVLDEGHMIGLSEREVRYEVQIQRLLRRDDAGTRRIVCLSAILPDGTQLEDFSAWLTRDQQTGLIKKEWRPTTLRFGEVMWKDDHARLDIFVGGEQPWIEHFITSVPPKGLRRRSFPSDQRELCIATAWTLVADGHSVLIFCPIRKSVEPFAKAIADLASRDMLSSVLQHDESMLDNAIAIGAEWLGADSAVLKCLRLGVAVHHGALPTQYRKEVERLLREGVLRVTVSSPTLAQGLNLTATTVVFHGLSRSGEDIDVAEFRNVVGRAGRAYVDGEGLVLLPMFDDIGRRRAAWRAMIKSSKGKEMESGLIRLTLTLVQRMIKKVNPANVDGMLSFLTGNAAWAFPELSGESEATSNVERDRWNRFLTSLDTALLGLLGDSDVADADIEATLDRALTSSLWARRIRHRNDVQRQLLQSVLTSRARYVWSDSSAPQRRGYYLAGVGLGAGKLLDSAARTLNQLLATANGAIIVGDSEAATSAIVSFAEIVFSIPAFKPDVLPAHWQMVLRLWLSGERIAASASGGDEATVLQFVEQALVYRLPWAMEAVRVRAIAHGDALDSGLRMEDLQLDAAVASVETGTLNQSAATLIRAGFSSRSGAIAAVERTGGDFVGVPKLRLWLRTEEVLALGADPTWPTRESHGLWLQFLDALAPARTAIWRRHSATVRVAWDGANVAPGTAVRLYSDAEGTLVLDSTFGRLGRLVKPINRLRHGLVIATSALDEGYLDIAYLGPDDLAASA